MLKRYDLLTMVEKRLSKRVGADEVNKLIPAWYFDDLHRIANTNIALMMAHGARSELKASAKRRKQLEKIATVPESARDIAGFLSVPQDIAAKIKVTLDETYTKDYWQKHAKGTQSWLKKTLTKSIKNGWTPEETSKFIRDDSGGAFGLTSARRIVRTETTGAINGGNHIVRQVDIADGIIQGEEWLATLDQDVRPEHYEAHGQELKLVGGQWVTVKGAKQLNTGQRVFIVGDERARFPGDPNLSAAMRINCRCTTVPVVDLNAPIVPQAIPQPDAPGVPSLPKPPRFKKPPKRRVSREALEPPVPTIEPPAFVDVKTIEPLGDDFVSGLSKDAKTIRSAYLKQTKPSYTVTKMLDDAVNEGDSVYAVFDSKTGAIRGAARVTQEANWNSVKQLHFEGDADIPVKNVMLDLWKNASQVNKAGVRFKGSPIATKQYNDDVLEFIGAKYREQTEDWYISDKVAQEIFENADETLTFKQLQAGKSLPKATQKAKVVELKPPPPPPEPVAPPPVEPPASAPTVKPAKAPIKAVDELPDAVDADEVADRLVGNVEKGFPEDLDGLKRVKNLGGSTGAELVEDASGRRFVLKKGNSREHIVEEFVAERAYRQLGVSVPRSTLYRDGSGDIWKLSEFVNGRELGALSKAELAAIESQLTDGFAADALLSNWDVIGLSQDNVLIDGAGKVWRIDVGGSLRFRAQGAAKADTFKDTVGELWSMAERKDASSYPIFKSANYERRIESAKKLLETVKTKAKRQKFLDTFDDPWLRAKMDRRLASLENIVESTEEFVSDSWKWDYVSDVQRHRVGLQDSGVAQFYDQKMKHRSVTLVDQDGKDWDSLRGRGDSASKKFGEYLDANGGSVVEFERWCTYQASNSWKKICQAYKVLIAESREVAVDSYYWGGYGHDIALKHLATELAGKQAEARQTLAAVHANTYEMLKRMDFKNNNRKKGTINLIRTLNRADIESEYNVRLVPGTKGALIKEGAAESTSVFRHTKVYGDTITRRVVPHTRVINTYFLERPNGYRMFAGDAENEFLAVLEGLKLDVR